ncbi:hypothetical protein Pla123a_28500 [Posidoniimonas polymericola]|uniref:DUF1559 domain-containing protein n=1 Tax=Posidoniimonas polymericola TaxID=2528002 RepID=A0A5C5YM68_9BACT|nr:DUF1559 domain-containing protein [Posidoniimonas polymericola]TWT76063.1 hypothetical protein Pla123a_28500 [Posidoniimonas polymericola]
MLTRIAVAVVVLIGVATSRAADTVWRRLADDQTLLVATAEVQNAEPPTIARELARYSPEVADEARRALEALREVGVVNATLVLGVQDLQTMSGPVLAISLAEDASTSDAAARLDELFAGFGWPRDTPHSLRIQQADKCLLVGSQRALDRYKSESEVDAKREELAAALQEARGDEPAITIVVSPGQDARHVIRELWPAMQTPCEALTGDLIADARHASVTVSLDPFEVELSVAGKDAAAAQEWKPLASAGLSALDGLLAQWRNGGSEAQPLSTAFPAKVDGASITLSLRGGSPAADELLGAVLPSVYRQVVERARTEGRMQQLKQLALGILNFESANGSLPAMAALRDPKGRPLLSWRVAILPYLEEGDLWRRFRLDEPWDSPHNLALVAEMPDVFANPARPDLNRRGMTVYQVPVGPRTIFPTAADAELIENRGFTMAKGLTFRDITDGSSNTLMIVEVAPEHAVPWTKPADWQFHEANPLATLRQEGRSSFVAARADGSVKPVSIEIPPAEFLKALTRNGEEIRDLSQW